MNFNFGFVSSQISSQNSNEWNSQYSQNPSQNSWPSQEKGPDMQFEFGFMNYETPQGSQEYMPQNIGRAPVKEDRLS